MIKNVIFDFGNVLATFDPRGLAAKFVDAEADANAIADAVFDSRWVDYDGGRSTYEEHLAGSLARLPQRLHEAAKIVFSSWHGELTPIKNTIGLVADLYGRGFGLYVLSNAPVEFSARARENYPFTKMLDGAVWSAEIKMDKPHAPIYRHLLDTYGLDPDECLFIDDKPENVEGARAVGMHALVYNYKAEKPLAEIYELVGRKSIVDRAHLAKRLFGDGYNCAQAVFLSFRDKIGMDETVAKRLSSSFGGGMGRMREVCGAVSGMLMVLGILCGYDPNEPNAGGKKAAHYANIQALCGKFREENGSIICRELLEGHIVKTGGEGEQTDAMRSTDPTPTPRTEEYYRKRPCGELVESAVQHLEAFLDTLEKEG